jgi:hypothetical protein
MAQFRCPKVGFFKRFKGSVLGFSMLAWLMASSLAWGQIQPFTFTPLLAHGTPGATTISINHKVVVNQYGMFVAYLQNTSEIKTQWRLARSVDHGASFTVIHASPDVTAPTADSTHVPLLETDSGGNVYMIRAGNFHSEADAYMWKYSPSTNFAPPTTQFALPSGSSQKCAMMIDEARGQLYFISETMRSNPTRTEVWFYVMGLDGVMRNNNGERLAYSTDPNLRPAWPHVTMDEQGDVYVAWTNIKGTNSAEYQHYSTHVMRSVNGGTSWQKLTGQSVNLPVISDPASTDINSIPMINNPGELGASMELWTMRVKEGKIHLAYQRRGDPFEQRYLRYDTVTGQKDMHTTSWGGQTIHLNSLDGFCTASNAADHTVYCVGSRAANGSPTTLSKRLAVLASYDNGQTWHDFATTEELGFPPYGITGAREIRDGHIIGMFTLQNTTPHPNNIPNVVQFFRIPVTANTPTMQRLHTANVFTNAAATGYPATNAIDGNPQTLWTASTTLDPANNNAFITIDLGANKQIDRVRWLSGIGTPFPSYCPAWYTISVSQDNVNWTTVHTRTLGPGNIQSSEPMGGVTARYVRMATTKVNDGNGWSLSFYEFWAEGSAMPPTRLSATTGGAQTPGYETSKADDGRYDTQFVHSLSMTPSNNVAAFKLSFGTTRHVARVKWVSAVGVQPTPTASAPRDFLIQVSNDDINWTTVASRAAPNLSGSTWEGSIPIGVSTQHVRILTSAIFDGTSGYALSFLEFWAEGW